MTLPSDHAYGVLPGISCVGYLNDEELSKAYQTAAVLVLPSLVESGPQPPLEAMSLGTPVIVADRPYAHDICEDAAIFFDPNSPEDFAEKAIHLLSDLMLRRDLIAKGLALVESRRAAEPYKQIVQILLDAVDAQSQEGGSFLVDKANNAVDFFSQIAVEFDAKYLHHPNFKERYDVWTRAIAKYSNSNYRALDIGCGTGIFTVNLASRNRSAIGIDGSHEMINLCEKRRSQSDLTNISFRNNDIRALKNNPIGKVDLVICSSVLEYLEDLDASFELIRSLLANNGIFIFSIPNKSSFYRKIEPLMFKVTGWPPYYRFVRNVFTLPRIEAKLKQHGFIFLESAYYGQVPLASKVFRKIGLAKFLDTLFIVVAQRT